MHVHVGSQITDLEPLRARRGAARRRWRSELRRSGIRSSISTSAAVSAISYDGAPVPSAADYVAAVLPIGARHRAADRDRAGPRDRRPGRRAGGHASST